MRILIACEESDEVRSKFEAMGFDAWSCDIQPNRNPKAKHFQKDIFEVLNLGWDAMIAFPPCTHLAVSGAAWFEQKRKDGRQKEAIEFFLAIAEAPIKHIAIENPIGVMSKNFRKPDQIIQPYYFGDPFTKTTCLWLKNLPLLYHNKTPNLFDQIVTHTDKGDFFEWVDSRTGNKKKQPMWYYKAAFTNHKNGTRSRIRSKTFPGIAEAMANQWGKYLTESL
jgi:site-specific DNA-cytosine methylase